MGEYWHEFWEEYKDMFRDTGPLIAGIITAVGGTLGIVYLIVWLSELLS